MTVIGGRWAVVRLARPLGPSVERLSEWMWHDVAVEELRRLRAAASGPGLSIRGVEVASGSLGLATCKECLSSDLGCPTCNPDLEVRVTLRFEGNASFVPCDAPGVVKDSELRPVMDWNSRDGVTLDNSVGE